MADLRDQLRAYVEATMKTADADEAMRRAAEPRPTPLLRRPAFVGLAAAVLALVVVGAVLLAVWLRGANPGPATTVPTTTTVPIGPDTLDALGPWTLVTVPDGPPLFSGGGNVVNEVVAGDSVAIAVGDATSGSENFMRDGGVWLSRDGSDWERVSDPEDFEFGGKGLNTVIAAGPGFIAGGGACDTEERCPFRPALWTSVDGTEWQRVADDPAVFGERGAVYDLIEFGSEILGLGADCYGDACEWVVWSSPDGFIWTRVWENDTGWPGALATNGTLLVAVGADTPEGFDHSVAIVWTSTDGVTWEQIPHDPTAFGTGQDVAWAMNDVASTSQGFVAVGTDGTNALAWFSPDGTTWELVSDPTGVFSNGSMTTAIPWRGGFLAAGPDWAIGEELGGPVDGMPSVPSQPTIWASPDGRTWYRIGIGDAEAVGSIKGLVEFAGRLIAVGQAGTFMDVETGAPGEDGIWSVELPPTLGG